MKNNRTFLEKLLDGAEVKWMPLDEVANIANNARKPLRRHQKTQLFILAIIVFVSETACCSVTSNMFLFRKQITLISLFRSF